MANFLIVYGTTEGQTAKIAKRIGTLVEAQGHTARIWDGKQLPDTALLEGCDAIIIGASVHYWTHPSYIQDFVKHHCEDLQRLPSAFFSVSGSAASPRPEERAQAERLAAEFIRETHWQPNRVATFAGAIPYTHYGLLKRLLMKVIIKRAGGDTDTSRNFEYTDWDAVRRFADDCLALIEQPIGLESG
jgi:menaquinone-dependent protoporphyrinogen oxidase